MESNIFGQIQCDHVRDSRALRRFTDKQIKNWVKSLAESSKISTLSPASYLVEFRREGSGHTFDCHIQVRLGNQTWVGYNYEGGLHQALIQCLHQMKSLPRLH